jgi:hypothetical protein
VKPRKRCGRKEIRQKWTSKRWTHAQANARCRLFFFAFAVRGFSAATCELLTLELNGSYGARPGL